MIKKIILVGLILLCLISGVNADTFAETYEDSTGKITTHPFVQPSTSISDQVIRFIDYPNVAVYDGLVFWGYTSRQSSFTSPIPEGETGIARIYSTKGIIAEGYFGSDYTYNLLGSKTGGQFWINFYECNIENITGQTASIGIYYLNGTPAGYLSGLGGVVIGAVSNTWDNGAGFGLYRSSTQSISCEVSNIVYQSKWNASIEATYNSGLISNVRYLRNGYYSSINLTDEDGISFYYDYSNSDIDYDFAHSNYNFEIINPYGRSFFESLIAEYDLSITKSKDKVLTLNEEETYYLKGLTFLDNIKTIIWTTQKLKDDGSRDENYYPTGERYQRINSTHFEKFVMANGAVLSEDILPVSNDFLEISESFTEDGKYKTSCDIFETSTSGLGMLIGSPYALTEVSDIGELVKIKVITINSETAGTISNCVLNVYKLNSTGETLIQNVLMPSSSANINLEFGELYRLEATKTGYVDAEVIKQITTPDIIILYLKPASGDGFTTASFTVRDTDKNRLADVKIEMDSKTKYTNTGGIATFTELDQNSTYTYTITHPDYVEETGTIETELEDLVNIEVVLYKESEVYPTPTETEGPSWITEKPSNMKDSFLLSFYMITGIEDLETLKLLSGVLLSAFIGIIAASITKDGTGFLAGGIIGFIGAIGLGWIPIWLLIALIVITGCYFIFSRGDS